MSAKAANGRPKSLWAFIETLTTGDAQPISSIDDENAPWYEPGLVCEIDEKTYWYFLELLPPRWIEGNWFAFGEGTGPFRLFWKMQDCYFARELTDEETNAFCQLSRTSLDL